MWALAKLSDTGTTDYIRAIARTLVSGRTRRRTRRVIPQLPEGVFRVLYADPPWKYSNSGVIGNDAYGRAERHYPTLSIEELCAINIREHRAESSVMFMWVTSPMLCECFPVIDAWGFTYKASIVWDKVRHNYGNYVSVRHELLLICTNGSCLPDNPIPMVDSVIVEDRRGRHSEKPATFRNLIDRLYPNGPRMELFGRNVPPPWENYSNERDRLRPTV